jgi:hypothetical protein
MKKLTLFFTITFAFTLSAQAKPVGTTFVSFGGLTNWAQDQRNDKVLSHKWWADLALGYTPYEFLSVGVIYSVDQIKNTTSGFTVSTDNYESRDYRASLGPQAHIWFEPFYLAASYFLNSKLTSELTTDGLSPYTYDGTGMGAEIGFLYGVGTIQFSLSVLYRNWKYAGRIQNGGGGSNLSPVLDQSRLDPSLKVWWVF